MGPFSNLPFDQIPTRFGFNASAPSIDVTPFEARDKGQFMFGGSSTLTVNLEATSFPRGEVIVVNTRVNNDAKKELVKVKARLRRHALLRAGAAEKAFSEEVKEAFLDGTKETGAVAERTFTFDTKSLQPCVRYLASYFERHLFPSHYIPMLYPFLRFTTPKCLKVWYSLLIKAEYSFATDPEVNVLLNILEVLPKCTKLYIDGPRSPDPIAAGRP